MAFFEDMGKGLLGFTGGLLDQTPLGHMAMNAFRGAGAGVQSGDAFNAFTGTPDGFYQQFAGGGQDPQQMMQQVDPMQTGPAQQMPSDSMFQQAPGVMDDEDAMMQYRAMTDPLGMGGGLLG
jgi:hypothetical protein